MPTDPVPPAYIHRSAGRTHRRPLTRNRLVEGGREALILAVGLWPLTATVLFATALLVSATQL